MKDNYSKCWCIALLILIFIGMFAIGLVSGYVIVKVDESITDSHTANLLIIYDVTK